MIDRQQVSQTLAAHMFNVEASRFFQNSGSYETSLKFNPLAIQ
jgi:hypothetical protein